MLYHHTFTATHDYAAPPEAAYPALLTQKIVTTDPNTFGAFLSLKRLWGTPGEVGFQQLARINWGAADLEMTETILATDPPRAFRISQRPQRFVPYDPHERLMPAELSVFDNFDALFAKTYGTPPATTEMQFDLSPTAMGCRLTLTIEARLVRKLGWFARRMWRKRAAGETTLIFQQIQTAIEAQ